MDKLTYTDMCKLEHAFNTITFYSRYPKSRLIKLLIRESYFNQGIRDDLMDYNKFTEEDLDNAR